MNLTIDSLRFLAIASIVWLHTPDSEALRWLNLIGRFGVPFFTATSAYLAVGNAYRKPGLTVTEYLRSRSLKVYGIFLCWSAIYALIRFAAWQAGVSTGVVFGPALLYNGAAHHLWYLPFVAVATGAAFACGRISQTTHRPLAFAVMAFAAALTSGVGLWFWRNTIPVYVVKLSVNTLPAFFAGVGIGLAFFSRPHQEPRERPFFGAVALATYLCAMGGGLLSGRQLAIENLAGVALLCFALAMPRSLRWRPLLALGAISFPIYLVHILMIESIQDIYTYFGVTASAFSDLACFALSMVLSIVFVHSCDQLPIVGGLMTLRSKTATT